MRRICTFIRYLRVLKIVCSNRKSGSNTFVDGLKQKVLYKNQGIYCKELKSPFIWSFGKMIYSILFYTQFMHDRIGTWKLNLTPQFGRSLTIDKFLTNSGSTTPLTALENIFNNPWIEIKDYLVALLCLDVSQEEDWIKCVINDVVESSKLLRCAH